MSDELKIAVSELKELARIWAAHAAAESGGMQTALAACALDMDTLVHSHEVVARREDTRLVEAVKGATR